MSKSWFQSEPSRIFDVCVCGVAGEFGVCVCWGADWRPWRLTLNTPFLVHAQALCHSTSSILANTVCPWMIHVRLPYDFNSCPPLPALVSCLLAATGPWFPLEESLWQLTWRGDESSHTGWAPNWVFSNCEPVSYQSSAFWRALPDQLITHIFITWYARPKLDPHTETEIQSNLTCRGKGLAFPVAS